MGGSYTEHLRQVRAIRQREREQRCTASSDQSPYLLESIASLLFDLGNFEEALPYEKRLQDLLEDRPHLPMRVESELRTVRALVRVGRLEEALSRVRSISARNSLTGDTLAGALAVLAWVETKRGQYDSAVQNCSRAASSRIGPGADRPRRAAAYR